jgi:transcriptional regulator with GAF, ATPase, and Fis domain
MSEETVPSATRRTRALVVTGPNGSVTYDLPERGTVVVGRDPEADLVFDDATLSRRHARVRVGDAVTIEDLSSKNGTRVRGRPLRAGEPQPLDRDTVAVLGAVMLALRERAPSPRGAHDIVVSGALEALADTVRKVAATDLPILLLGETGVGKDVFAEMIHARSPRHGRPLVRVHAAAVSESLFESELFGHEQGAFTGAVRARAGLLEAADGGTVFIDEVGEVPPTLQVKLLRVLEDRRVQRIGAVTQKKIDVRFVAATNRDLAEEVRRGTFRADLYHRLRGVCLRIPPLRERRAEIPALAESFLERAAPDKRFSPAALRELGKYPYLGNVRELRNIVERSALLARSATLEPADLLFDEQGSSERRRIAMALERTSGNQKLAAELLGISRRALLYKLDEHGLPRPRKRLSTLGER